MPDPARTFSLLNACTNCGEMMSDPEALYCETCWDYFNQPLDERGFPMLPGMWEQADFLGGNPEYD